MKVCLANDSFPPLIDGVSNAVVNYAATITEKYGEAVVATPRYPNVKDDYSFDVIRYTSLATEKLVGYRTGYPFSGEAMSRLEAFAPDIIHSHCPMASTFMARELRNITGAPIVFTYHTKFDIDIKRAIKLKFIQEPAIREVIQNIEACDEVWVVNRGAGENLKSLGFSRDYIVMPNGVDIDRSPADSVILQKLNDTYELDSRPLFLFVGRVMWYKGLRIILDALRSLKNEGVGFRMVFVGSGDDAEAVKAYAEEIGVGEDCVFTGAVYDRAELKAWYTRADLFLLPSVFDNNPLVVKEAAACSTASVLVRDSSSAEGVVDGVNGILIEENADSMARALIPLCREEDRGTIKRLGEGASRDLYVSWDDSIARAYARYEEVLREYGKRRIERTPVKHDKMIEFITSTYYGLAKAKLARDNFLSELEAIREDNEKTQDEIQAKFKEIFANIKDKFDRYQ